MPFETVIRNAGHERYDAAVTITAPGKRVGAQLCITLKPAILPDSLAMGDKVDVAIGTGEDAGKIRIAPAVNGSGFTLKGAALSDDCVMIRMRLPAQLPSEPRRVEAQHEIIGHALMLTLPEPDSPRP